MANKFVKFRKNIEINGETVFDYVGKLDYTLCQEDRVALVYKLLCDTFVDGYVEENLPKDYFASALSDEINGVAIINVCLNQTDSLSEDDPFFKAMQRFVNYILYAPDAPKIDKKTTTYNFYTDEGIFRKAQKEHNLGDYDQNTIDFLLQKPANFKKDKIIRQGHSFDWLAYAKKYYSSIIEKTEKTLKTLKKDLKMHENGEKVLKNYEYVDLLNRIEYVERKLRLLRRDSEIVLADFAKYNALIATATKAMNELKEENKLLDKFDAKKIANDVKIKKLSTLRNSHYEQEKFIFEAYTKMIYFKNPLKDEGGIDWEEFDIFNETHVMQALRMAKTYNDDVCDILGQVEKYLKVVKLDTVDQTLLDLIKFNTLKDVEIEDSLGLARGSLSSYLRKIAKKVTNVAKEDFIDFYYLEHEKGKYKKCAKCGEVLLTRYFDKMASAKDGFRPSCKSCR